MLRYKKEDKDPMKEAVITVDVILRVSEDTAESKVMFEDVPCQYNT